MGTLIQDIRYGFRTLLKKPAFTAAAVLALAVGIGANTAIFSIVNGILLRPLPYPDQDRIQMVYMTNVQQQRFDDPFSIADYFDLRNQNHTFEKIAGYSNGFGFTLNTDQGAEFINGSVVSADFFSVLGVRAQVGRTFEPGEDSLQAPLSVVISDRLWRRHFNADPGIVGRVVNFTNGPHTVIGVMPPDFQFPRDTVDIWRNYRLGPPTGRGPYLTWVLGKVKPGVSAEQLNGDLRDVANRLAQTYPTSNAGKSFRALTIHDFLYSNVEAPLYVLLGAVAFVFLIASANVANLLLARSTAREREVAIRVALGAGRTRIVRQLLTESIVLAGMGGLTGLAIASWSLDFLVAIAPAGIPRMAQIGLDVSVLGFTALASIISGLIFGLAPALQSKTVDLNRTLKEANRGNSGAGSNRLRRVLVVSEIALSLILLAGAGLTIRSFIRLSNVDSGFDARNVLAVRMGVNYNKYDTNEKILGFYDEIKRRVEGLPGVQSTGLTNSLPPIQNDASDSFTIENQAIPTGEQAPVATVLLVTPGYFKTLSIPVLRGRSFTADDRAGSAPVTLINEALARQFFPNQDPLGKRMKIGGSERPNTPWMEIVGVVKDVRYDGLNNTAGPGYYLPYAQVPQRGQDMVIKTSGDPSALVSAVRAEIRSVDADIPLTRVTTLTERIAQAVGEPRFQTLLLGIFAGIALLLAAVGIYGVLSYSISLRTHEIGVRMSLGASRRDVLQMVIREGMVLAIAGAVIGLASSLALTRVMSSVLFEVSPHDPLTLIAVTLVMLGVAFLACFIPARRATRVDPMVALRYE